MSTPSPFPLNISTKQDSYERVVLLANVPEAYKWIAADFNTIIQALNYLHENSAGVPSTTPGYETIYFGAGAILITEGNSTTLNEIAQHINAVGFTITAGKLAVLNLTVLRQEAGQSVWAKELYLFTANNTAGTWGTGSTNGEISSNQLIFINRTILQQVSGDEELISLGDIGNDTIDDFVNAVDPGTVTWEELEAGTDYFFICQRNGNREVYKYVGALPVTLGVGGDTVDITDFDLQNFQDDDDAPTQVIQTAAETPIEDTAEIYTADNVEEALAEVKTQANSLAAKITAILSSYSRRPKVIDIVDNTAAPPTEIMGDRYILDFTGTSHADWDGAAAGRIVQFDGTSWIAEYPFEGWICYVDEQNKDALFVNDGTPQWELRDLASTPTEEQVIGNTLELDQTDAVSDIITLDLANFSSCKIHIDSADIEIDDTTNRPASGKSFTKYYELSTENGTEAYTLPAAWKLFGELDASVVNYIAVEYSNYTSAGMRIKAYINQETV